MSKGRNKSLVETSAVRARVGPTTSRHREAFDEASDGAVLYTSAYVRMEFIRRWICTQIDMALTVSRFGSVAEAITYLEQEFSIRTVKAVLASLAEQLDATGAMGSSEAAAEELARTAFHWIRRFDRCFPSKIQNRSHCRRGGRELNCGSFETILDDLAVFHEEFSQPISDCQVNQFLKLSDPRSAANKLRNAEACANLACMKNLEKYAAAGTHITCTECERIGDAVIALEQTKGFTLLHIDKSFDVLCEARGMPHQPIASLRAAERDARKHS